MADIQAAIRPLFQVGLGKGKHAGLVIRRRCRRQRAAGNGLIQIAAVKNVELIQISAVYAGLNQQIQIFLPDLHVLTGQTVNEVDDDSTLVVIEKSPQIFQYRFFIVQSSDRTADIRMKGLNAQRHAVYTICQPNVHLFRYQIMNTPFQSQLVIIGQGQAAANRLQQPSGIFRRQGCRRTAADKYGMNKAVL